MPVVSSCLRGHTAGIDKITTRAANHAYVLQDLENESHNLCSNTRVHITLL